MDHSTADLPGLNRLHARENDVYAQHRRAAIEHPYLRRVLRLIDDSLDFMIEVAGGPLPTDDARTISAIAGRIFNTTAGALREAFNGYPQTSFLLQRDLIEIHTLLDVFSHDLTRIPRWREVTNAERLDEFSPAKLRKVLEGRDGAEEIRVRRADYQMFSENAAHLTYPGLRMLQLPNGSTQLGPRLDVDVLGQCLHELGRRVLLAAVCDARVMFMLHARDGQPIPTNVDTMVTEVHAEGMKLYAPKPAAGPESSSADDHA
jgi:hypothetical protein